MSEIPPSPRGVSNNGVTLNGGAAPKRTALITVLVGTMAASTFHLFAVGVLAAELKDEIGLTGLQIGIVGAVNTGLGAITSPRLGSITDKIGARAASAITCVLSGIGLLVMAVATNLLVLLGSSILSGPSQGWSNPATNRLIADRLEPNERGTITGLKQSGVQFGSFVAGLTLPTAADLSNWRIAVAILGVASFAVALLARFGIDADPVAETNPDDLTTATAKPTSKKLDPFVVRVAIFATLFGLSTGGVFRFLPLFAEQELSFSTTGAGLLIAVNGALGIVGRIIWGQLTERSVEPRKGLLTIGIASIVCVLGLALSLQIGGWVLWPFAAVSAFCLGSWNVVAMLAVIRTVPASDSGRSTGFVMLGFLGGLTIASPLTGLVDDVTGSFQLAWWGLLAATVIGTLTMTGNRTPNRS